MEITSNLIEESISRPTGKVKSPFASENVSQKNVEKQNAESKFAQLANISRIFGKACSTHEKSIVKKLRKVRYSTQKR